MASRNYKYYQPNDKDLKDNYGDCVVRALTKVTGKSWSEAFEALLPYAIELQCMPNSQVCYERYLKEHGFEYHGISNKKGSKRPTVDRYNSKKTWEVVKMVGGYYLRQYVDGQQVNTGLRTTKAFIASIGIFEFERIE